MCGGTWPPDQGELFSRADKQFSLDGADDLIDAISRSERHLVALTPIYAPNLMPFAPAGARGNFSANRFPRLAPWAKIFRPPGPGWADSFANVFPRLPTPDSRFPTSYFRFQPYPPRSSAPSNSRFLCLGGLLRGFSSRRVGGGWPARSRAWRLTSFHPLNASFFGGLLGLMGVDSIALGSRSRSQVRLSARD